MSRLKHTHDTTESIEKLEHILESSGRNSGIPHRYTSDNKTQRNNGEADDLYDYNMCNQCSKPFIFLLIIGVCCFVCGESIYWLMNPHLHHQSDIHVHTWLLWISSVIFTFAAFKGLVDCYITKLVSKHPLFVSDIYVSGQWERYFRQLPMIIPIRNFLFVLFSFIIWCLLLNYFEMHHFTTNNNNSIQSRFNMDVTNVIELIIDNEFLFIIGKIYICVLILFFTLFIINSLILPMVLSKIYLKRYTYYVEKFLRLENYLRVILDYDEIFYPNLKTFLLTYTCVINSNMKLFEWGRNRKHSRYYESLQTAFNFSNDGKHDNDLYYLSFINYGDRTVSSSPSVHRLMTKRAPNSFDDTLSMPPNEPYILSRDTALSMTISRNDVGGDVDGDGRIEMDDDEKKQHLTVPQMSRLPPITNNDSMGKITNLALATSPHTDIDISHDNKKDEKRKGKKQKKKEKQKNKEKEKDKKKIDHVRSKIKMKSKIKSNDCKKRSSVKIDVYEANSNGYPSESGTNIVRKSNFDLAASGSLSVAGTAHLPISFATNHQSISTTPFAHDIDRTINLTTTVINNNDNKKNDDTNAYGIVATGSRGDQRSLVHNDNDNHDNDGSNVIHVIYRQSGDEEEEEEGDRDKNEEQSARSKTLDIHIGHLVRGHSLHSPRYQANGNNRGSGLNSIGKRSAMASQRSMHVNTKNSLAKTRVRSMRQLQREKKPQQSIPLWFQENARLTTTVTNTNVIRSLCETLSTTMFEDILKSTSNGAPNDDDSSDDDSTTTLPKIGRYVVASASPDEDDTSSTQVDTDNDSSITAMPIEMEDLEFEFQLNQIDEDSTTNSSSKRISRAQSLNKIEQKIGITTPPHIGTVSNAMRNSLNNRASDPISNPTSTAMGNTNTNRPKNDRIAKTTKLRSAVEAVATNKLRPKNNLANKSVDYDGSDTSNESQFVTMKHFARMFSHSNICQDYIRAFNKFDINKRNLVSRQDIEKQLFSLFTSVILVRSKFESYYSVLVSIQNAMTVFILFLLVFIFLLIFESSFLDALSIYVSIVAIIILFGSSPISQLINGVVLLFAMRPFEVGDIVSIDNKRFEIKKINLLTTWMTDRNNIMYVWSNEEILNKKMNNFINYTQTGESRHCMVLYVPVVVGIRVIKQLVSEFRLKVQRHMGQDCGDVTMRAEWHQTPLIASQWKIEIFVTSYIPFDDSQAILQAKTHLWQLLQAADQKFHILGSPVETNNGKFKGKDKNTKVANVNNSNDDSTGNSNNNSETHIIVDNNDSSSSDDGFGKVKGLKAQLIHATTKAAQNYRNENKTGDDNENKAAEADGVFGI